MKFKEKLVHKIKFNIKIRTFNKNLLYFQILKILITQIKGKELNLSYNKKQQHFKIKILKKEEFTQKGKLCKE